MQKPELIGVVVSTTEGLRLQLLDDKDTNRFIVRYQDAGQVDSDIAPFSYKEPGTKDHALVAALDEFVKRIRAEREGLVTYVPIEEFSLLLNPSSEPVKGDYHVYYGKGDELAVALMYAETAVIEAGVFDMEALRADTEYNSAIARLLDSPPLDEFSGIALLIL